MKNDCYIIYTEILDIPIERWYYGSETNADKANRIALERGNSDNAYTCVCTLEAAEGLHILNMPDEFKK